ncbi:MAG: PQQ-binding-like beta-propeller repeat protein [Planctomycetaceae bacterium]
MSMSRRDALITITSASLTAVATPRIGADDPPALTTPAASAWSSFRNGPQQRGIANTKLTDNPKLKWEVVSRDGWVATCAIAGEHVYAPALRGYLHCFHRDTGRELWKYRSIENPDEKAFAPGFKAAPLVTADAVYAGDEDGTLHAVSRTDGRGMWKFETGGEIAGGVTPYENELLLASHDSFLYCLTKQGEEVWKFQTNDRINCSPALSGNLTFVSGCDEHLRIIDVRNGMETLDLPLKSILIASPAIVGDMLYVGTHNGDVLAVNCRTGEIAWRYTGDRPMPYYASAAVTDDLVMVGSHDKLMHAIDRRTGEGRWTFSTNARIESSAAVVDNRLFFGSADRNLYGVSIDDGSEVWKFSAGKAITAGVAIGEGCLVVGEDDQNGRLRCFG